MTDQQMVRTIVKSVRLNPIELSLINAECQTRNIVFSEFIRATTLGNLHEQRQRKSDPIRPLRWLISA
jgi:hypothetical protein